MRIRVVLAKLNVYSMKSENTESQLQLCQQFPLMSVEARCSLILYYATLRRHHNAFNRTPSRDDRNTKPLPK